MSSLLSKTEWLNELELEAAAFDEGRANKLAASGRVFIDEMLASGQETSDELFRYGVLQQRCAERLSISAYSNLYDAADQMITDSIRLLNEAHQLEPDNEMIVWNSSQPGSYTVRFDD